MFPQFPEIKTSEGSTEVLNLIKSDKNRLFSTKICHFEIKDQLIIIL